MKTIKTFYVTFAFIFLGLVPILAMGQSMPHTFTANSAAKASEVNANFKHLQDQFFWNKKEIDCSSDNLTATINDGYNHIVINGGCSIKSLTTGGVDFTRYCEDNSDHKPIHRIRITGKTGKSTDSITVGDLGTCGQIIGPFGGFMHIENIQINTTNVNVTDGGYFRAGNSTIYAEDSESNGIVLHKGSLIVMENSSAIHWIKAYTGSVGEFMNSTTTKGLEAELGSTFSADNMSMLNLEVRRNAVANIKNSTMLNLEVRRNSSAFIENSTINCSAKDINCVKVDGKSYTNLYSSTITGGANEYAIVLGSLSLVELSNSTVNSTKTSSIQVEGPLSYLNTDSNTTINGTVTCGNIQSHAFKAGTDLCQ